MNVYFKLIQQVFQVNENLEPDRGPKFWRFARSVAGGAAMVMGVCLILFTLAITAESTDEGFDVLLCITLPLLIGTLFVFRVFLLANVRYQNARAKESLSPRQGLSFIVGHGTTPLAMISILIIIGASIVNQSPQREREILETQGADARIAMTRDANATATATLWTETPTFTPSATFTPSRTPTLTDTPTITNTPLPTATITNTPMPSNTPVPLDTPTPTLPSPDSGTTYYAQGVVNARECPRTDCDVIAELRRGNIVKVVGFESGENIPSLGGDTWFVGYRNNTVVYIHGALLSRQRPSALVQPQTSGSGSSSSTGSSGSTTTRRPDNCDDAVTMGLSAVQAAQWDHLDRDNDGVACYGD